MSTLSPKASFVQIHFLSNCTVTWDVCHRPLLQLTVDFRSILSYFCLNISNAHASFQLQCLCCHKCPILLYSSLATNVRSSGIFVTVKWDLYEDLDCFCSLQYESYFVSHVSKAQLASFHLQCLCGHQKPAVCKYIFLATTVQSTRSFVTERVCSLQYESYSVFHVSEATL